jgi:two-component system phosphate regulon sensor histidine kinase PhoR
MTMIMVLGFVYTIYIILSQKRLAEIKNDFINNMTHEFKTPIATIAIANESIRDPRVFASREKMEYYSDVIRDENQRMLRQVENVLQMAQIDKGELALKQGSLDVHDVLQQAISSSALTVEQRSGTIRTDFSASEFTIFGDGNHLLNVFINLIDNANKYSPETPEITIRTSNTDSSILISISDQGIGMTKETQKRIFDTFYRASTGNIHDVKGFGLGLSYVKAIVEKHMGSITVHSEPGKGSTFIVSLPLNT